MIAATRTQQHRGACVLVRRRAIKADGRLRDVAQTDNALAGDDLVSRLGRVLLLAEVALLAGRDAGPEINDFGRLDGKASRKHEDRETHQSKRTNQSGFHAEGVCGASRVRPFIKFPVQIQIPSHSSRVMPA